MYRVRQSRKFLREDSRFRQGDKKFFDYIQPGNTLRRGEVNHTFAAVRYIFEMSDGVDNEVRELLAYAVGAHHGQFDAVNDDHKMALNTD